ncbi:MAG: hypothetical protein JWQ13_2435 [Ramlibacter sp.]|jgi:hypothetical protein|nr:hypothetical protein [Ramlibacter sp.]
MTSVVKFHAAVQPQPADAGPLLPPAFADLEPWVAQWSIATEKARAETRVATPIAVLREFHAALLPRLEPMIQYFNTLPNDPDALSPPDKRLYALAQMVMEVSAPIDLNWDTPDIEDVFPMHRMKFHPPSV